MHVRVFVVLSKIATIKKKSFFFVFLFTELTQRNDCLRQMKKMFCYKKTTENQIILTTWIARHHCGNHDETISFWALQIFFFFFHFRRLIYRDRENACVMENFRYASSHLNELVPMDERLVEKWLTLSLATDTSFFRLEFQWHALYKISFTSFHTKKNYIYAFNCYCYLPLFIRSYCIDFSTMEYRNSIRPDHIMRVKSFFHAFT